MPVEIQTSAFPAVETQVDGILFVGPASVQVPARAGTYAYRRYVAELRRRGEILGPVLGVDVGSTLDALVAREAHRPR